MNIVTVPGELSELGDLDYLAAMPYHEIVARFVAGELSEDALRLYGAVRGYRSGWAWHCLQERRASELASAIGR